MAEPERRRNHLYIELEEYSESGTKWHKTGRWNHAFEEEVIAGDSNHGKDSWARPHLPIISFHALVQLRKAFCTTNVMIDVPGDDFIDVVDEVLRRLVSAGDLTTECSPRVRDALTRLTLAGGLKSPLMTPTMPAAVPPSALPLSPGLPASMLGDGAVPPASPISRTRLAVVPKGLGALKGLGASSREVLPALPPLDLDGFPPSIDVAAANVEPAHGGDASAPPVAPTSPSGTEEEPSPVPRLPMSPDGAEARQRHKMLAPDADEEALDLVLAHVAFVDKPIMAFVRCAHSIDAGCESHVPVRYLFLLIGPELTMQRSTQMAQALAGCFLDEPFVANVADSTDANSFLKVFDTYLEHVAILPHVHVPHASLVSAPSGAPPHAIGAPNVPHSTSASESHYSSSEADPQSEDEDNVIIADLEDHLRSTKGLPERQRGNSFHGGSLHGEMAGVQRRPSFADKLNTATEMAAKSSRNASANPSPAIKRRGPPLAEEHPTSQPFTPIPSGLGLAGLAAPRAVPFEGLANASPSLMRASPQMAEPTGSKARMFMELEQCVDGVWSETHHWNWAFAQEADAAGGWSRPHLPTISASALIALYEGLGEHNVLLDVPALTLQDVAKPLAAALVRTGNLPAALECRAVDILGSRIRSSMISPLVPATPRPDLLDLSPAVDEEAFDLLIVHTDIVTTPALAFARLAVPIQLGCENAAPVRFIFVMLSPKPFFGQKKYAEECVHMASAFAAVMLDQDLVSALRACATVPTFIELFSTQIECITIVPHSHIKPEQRDTPPAVLGPSLVSEEPTSSTKRFSFKRSSPPPAHISNVANAPEDKATSHTSAPEAIRASRVLSGDEAAVAVAVAAATAGSVPSRHDLSQHGQLELLEGRASPQQGWRDGRHGRKRAITRGASMPAMALKYAARSAPHDRESLGSCCRRVIHDVQRFSIPLLLGIIVALFWANLHPSSYEYFVGADYHLPHFSPLGQHTYLLDHKITVHFLVNDIFMVFFFGIATKEVTEALLPGGSLNPLRKAVSPLVGTIGGVCGPIAVYLAMCGILYAVGAFDGYESKYAVAAREDLLTAAAGGIDSGSVVDVTESSSSAHRILSSSGSSSTHGSAHGSESLPPFDFSSPEARLGFAEIAHGWGVPCATDISLAWMVAAQVFPLRHPAIEFLLLLAVADDAIGLAIIAIAYGDPDHPVEIIYMLYVLLGVFIAMCLRCIPHPLRNWWSPYLILGGIPCWVGLISARLHPALAFVFVVPFLPATILPTKRGPKSEAPVTEWISRHRRPVAVAEAAAVTSVSHDAHHDPHAALHAFEHKMKLPINLGMFFFTLANAGVRLEHVGPLTLIIFLSLFLGKLLGIVTMVMLADRFKLAPLNARIKAPDITMVASMASIGLTVALFIAGEAYEQERLQSEAKLGALLSGLVGVACVAFGSTPWWQRRWAKPMVPLSPALQASLPLMRGSGARPGLRTVHYDYEDTHDIVAAALERSMLLNMSSLELEKSERMDGRSHLPATVEEDEEDSVHSPAPLWV